MVRVERWIQTLERPENPREGEHRLIWNLTSQTTFCCVSLKASSSNSLALRPSEWNKITTIKTQEEKALEQAKTK